MAGAVGDDEAAAVDLGATPDGLADSVAEGATFATDPALFAAEEHPASASSATPTTHALVVFITAP